MLHAMSWPYIIFRFREIRFSGHIVKHGFVKGGFVKHGFVKHGLTRCFSHG